MPSPVLFAAERAAPIVVHDIAPGAPLRVEADAAMLHVERIETDAALAALADEWNALADDIPFRRQEWLATWWRHYRTRHDDLFVLAVRDADDTLIGLAPLYRTRSLASGRLLRFLGSGSVASDHLSLLVAPHVRDAASRAIASWLAAQSAAVWDRIELDGVDADDAAIETFIAALTTATHCRTHRDSVVSCWQTPLPADWNTFLAGLSSSRRSRLRKLMRDAFDTDAGRIVEAHTPDEVRRGHEVLAHLHQLRRTSQGDRGCFDSDLFGPFQLDVMQQFAAMGRLRLWWLEWLGEPAAIEYQLLGGGAAYFYQSGLNPDLERHRPGWVIKAATIRQAIADGLHTFDFLRGDEPYKASWAAIGRPVLEIRIVRNRPAAQLRHAAWRVGRWAKRQAKAWLARRAAKAASGNDSARSNGVPE